MVVIVILGLTLFLTTEPTREHEIPEIAEAPVQVINVQNLELELFALEKPDPLSITQLQANLSSFKGETPLVAIGGYPLGFFERDLLQPVLPLIEEKGYQLGFLLLDINTGWGVAYNADEIFYSASSIKGIYVASVTAEQPELASLWAGTMHAAIQSSDNDAYFALRLSLGDDFITKWCQQAGVEPFDNGEWFPYYSSRTLAKLWLKNYEYFESGGTPIKEVESWYGKSFNSLIHENLGMLYEVSTKPGWIADEEFVSTVDAGIVYAGGNPYLLIIMTDAPMHMVDLGPLILSLDRIQSRMHEPSYLG